jgi:hypothetical protein
LLKTGPLKFRNGLICAWAALGASADTDVHSAKAATSGTVIL